MSKLEKTIKLTDATFEEVAEFLNKKAFHAQNPTESLRKIESHVSFEIWKNETLSKYPEAFLVIKNGGDWFNEVRVSDPVFQEDGGDYNAAKTSFLETNFYGG